MVLVGFLSQPCIGQIPGARHQSTNRWLSGAQAIHGFCVVGVGAPGLIQLHTVFVSPTTPAHGLLFSPGPPNKPFFFEPVRKPTQQLLPIALCAFGHRAAELQRSFQPPVSSGTVLCRGNIPWLGKTCYRLEIQKVQAYLLKGLLQGSRK